MPTDHEPSNGYEHHAAAFAAHRNGSAIGVETIRRWAGQLPPGASVLDLGCGTGDPVSTTLAQLGFTVAGIDASPTLIAAFRRRMPKALWACEPVECKT